MEFNPVTQEPAVSNRENNGNKIYRIKNIYLGDGKNMDSVNSKPILQGEYKLLKVLQKLPYSTYYLGTSLHNPGKRWAVKEVFLDFEGPEDRLEAFRQFERIARKYVKLEHSSLVPLADCFYENNYEYIIFEFIPGHRLQEIIDLRKKPFSEFQAMDLALKIGDVLKFLHERGIIFHDLNPSNVIITPEGDMRLTDYGLGKILAKRDKNQPRWGTVGYGPPEQVGDDATITESCDVYALGVIIHQMLTFWDPTLSKGVIPPIRKLNPDVSEDMETLILNATYHDANLRYPSADEFLKDLQKIMKIEPETDKSEETWLHKLAKEFSRPFKSV